MLAEIHIKWNDYEEAAESETHFLHGESRALRYREGDRGGKTLAFMNRPRAATPIS